MTLNTHSAFPIQDSNPYAKGLTKRELFAMAAMQGLCSNHVWLQEAFEKAGPYEAVTYAARASVEAADALISALESA